MVLVYSSLLKVVDVIHVCVCVCVLHLLFNFFVIYSGSKLTVLHVSNVIFHVPLVTIALDTRMQYTIQYILPVNEFLL